MKRIALVLGLSLLLTGPAARKALSADVSHAESCGRCHRDILEAWKESAHAHAMENPLFQDVLELAQKIGGRSVRSTCLQCHAPTVQYSGDQALDQKASWEGVTCDFCHSVKSVEFPQGEPRYQVAFDGVKTGPLGDASSPAHGTQFSKVHTTSLICAGCHNYRNPSDFEVLGTYSEWKESRYSDEEIHCQQCHMAEEEGRVVDPKVKRLEGTTVNLHAMPGSRSIEQLNRAVQMRMSAEREDGTLVVKVRVGNRGAGHRVPTGSPLRRLSLDVQVNVGGDVYQEQINYQRRVADSTGRELFREEYVFLKSASELSDTRLKPDEEREEIFRFPVSSSRPARVKAALSYHYSPRQTGPDATSVNFLVLTQYAPPVRR